MRLLCIVLVALAGAASAAPTITIPTNNNPLLPPAVSARTQTCPTTAYPALRPDPQTPIAALHPTYPFRIALPASPGPGDDNPRAGSAAVDIGFSIPSSSATTGGQAGGQQSTGPCTLTLDLSSRAARAAGAATVSVYALDGPALGALVGTVRTAAARAGRVTVNSFTCRAQMGFRLEVAAGGRGGGGQDEGDGVEFLQGDVAGMGFAIMVGC